MALAVVERLRFIQQQPDQASHWPPHWLVHALEASALYSRSSEETPVSHEQLQRLMAAFARYRDPSETHLLEKGNLRLWLMLQSRRQFQLQQRVNRLSMGRCLRLLWHNEALRRTSEILRAKLSFGIEDFLVGSLVLWSSMQDKPHRCVRWDYFDAVPTDLISRDVLRLVIEELAQDQSSMAKQFAFSHDMSKPLQAASAESTLLRRPIISFRRGLLAPIPDLLLPATMQQLFELSISAAGEVMRDEFRCALERYAITILCKVPRFVGDPIAGEYLDEVSPGLHCDSIFELEDCILVVECKAIQPTARLLDEAVLANAKGSGPKLAKAFRQLQASAADIRNGVLSGCIKDPNKPIRGIVLTYGEFPEVNSRWFRTTAIEPFLTQFGPLPAHWPHPLANSPVVFSPHCLDYFTLYLNCKRQSPVELFSRFQDGNDEELAEWDRLLPKLVGDQPDPLRDFFRKPFDDLWESRFASSMGPRPMNDSD